MKKPIILIVTTSIVILQMIASSYAQSYNSLLKLADSAYKNKDYLYAATCYKQLANKEKVLFTKRNHFYLLSCCYAKAGDTAMGWTYLDSAILVGYSNYCRILTNPDLKSLQASKERWKQIGLLNKVTENSTNDPEKAELVTGDIINFWVAYDNASKDSTHALDAFNDYYFKNASEGLKDYFSLRIYSTELFMNNLVTKKAFYKAIRKNTLRVEQFKEPIRNSFIKLKSIYPAASFPNVYFVIGRWTSAGTVSRNGLLIGTDMLSKSSDIPLHELSLWEKNNYKDIEDLPYIVAHELVHSQQNSMRLDTTTLSACIREGMADFIGELISGKTSNERLKKFAKGKEKQLWQEFTTDMYLNRSNHWIANSIEERPDRPADLGYWIGYEICKSYYENVDDKKKAVFEMLHITNYKSFLEKSMVEEKFKKSSEF